MQIIITQFTYREENVAMQLQQKIDGNRMNDVENIFTLINSICIITVPQCKL